MAEIIYKPNSHKYHEEQANKDENEKNLKPVVTGNVVAKKESAGKKIANTFLAETMENTGKYMLHDVVIPAVVDTIVDALTSGISMLFKGSPAPSRGRRSDSGKVNYTSYARSSNSGYKEREERRYDRDRYGMLDICYETRGDAIEVRDCLIEVMDKYHVVSVSDYYELARQGDQINYTDRKYGWYDLGDLAISRDRDGYRIRLPKPEALD